jgi:hypothetical protein
VPETRDPTRAGLTPAVLAAAAVSLAAAAAFAAAERRSRHPMLPLELNPSRGQVRRLPGGRR